jgi:hypothetical protein
MNALLLFLKVAIDAAVVLHFSVYKNLIMFYLVQCENCLI